MPPRGPGLAALPPLHDRVRSRLSTWRQIGASSHVLSWIREGVPVLFRGGRPPPPFRFRSRPLIGDAAKWWAEEEGRLRATGALEPATCSDFVSRAFLVPKKSGGFRLVVDLRPVNKFCVRLRCRYESLRLLSRICPPGAHMIAFDLADAYHHLSIRPADRKFFTFELNGSLYQCAGLPFGWSNSPYYFTKFTRPLVSQLRSPFFRSLAGTSAVALSQRARRVTPAAGLGILPYLDDFLCVASSQTDAELAVPFVQSTLQSLGLQAHPTKCCWSPTQRLEHLGFVVDTDRGVFAITPARFAQIRAMAKDLGCRAARGSRWVKLSQLKSFCGTAVSTLLAVPPARHYLRALYDCMSAASSWPGHARLSRQALRDLHWWGALPSRWCNRPIRRSPVSHHLYTDASGSVGWGAVLDAHRVARGSWRPQQQPLHITHKELLAVDEWIAARKLQIAMEKRTFDRKAVCEHYIYLCTHIVVHVTLGYSAGACG